MEIEKIVDKVLSENPKQLEHIVGAKLSYKVILLAR